MEIESVDKRIGLGAVVTTGLRSALYRPRDAKDHAHRGRLGRCFDRFSQERSPSQMQASKIHRPGSVLGCPVGAFQH